MISLQILFWLAVLVLGYTYLGYPLLIWTWAKHSGRPHIRKVMNPRVSAVVVAHNEGPRIARRINNLLETDYDPDRLEIVIVSDGSTDETVAIAKSYEKMNVRVVDFEQNRGKPAVLNDVIPKLSGEIVVLMDVRQTIATNALQTLVDNFADLTIGGVSGELLLTKRAEGESSYDSSMDGVGFYWRYEKFIRRCESRVDSTIGVTGALYAIRRNLFVPIPADTILDDVLIPMQVVRKGYRILFDSAARASECLSETSKMEYRRKVRTIAGNFQLLAQHPWLLNPFDNRVWLQTVSHKLFRLLCPAFLVLQLVSNLMLLDYLFYQVTFLLQMLFYTAALTTVMAPRFSEISVLFSVPHAFCLLNLATVAGFFRFISGRQKVTWSQIIDPEPH